MEQLRAAITEVNGSRWDDQMYAGRGYVVTETLSRTGYFVGYRGVRRTVHGSAAIAADERFQETGRATFGRFEDAVKAYLAAVVESLLLPSRGRTDSAAAWMWDGSPGPGVVVAAAGARTARFRYHLRSDPAVWIDGDKVDAPLSHGLSMSTADFLTALVRPAPGQEPGGGRP
ncbi:hypothetical protein CH260_03845 [Rhodococcus sp. 05-2256-B2]|uniref:hypothetical protein n=1 Tax=Nocardiaceae TaxID=85025 RepID=UPI00050CFE0B|nr:MULTISPECIES: hypothetical protein [Rhodococcus]MBY4382145.1 hypothetical protein [Rhodococcus fascians]MBY4397014.1 hypothetical protein [Rhodococcus fascians]MBY4405834.1 hypothetical protein [Rhodococcus fascians]MBY4421772.1 hypothetical protein [Rhodococcus fascians]MBY4460958.1 hypothetical protein [Rhodococcus fascians]